MCMDNSSFSSSTSMPPSLSVENYIPCDPFPTLLDNQYNMVGGGIEEGYYGDFRRILEPKEVRDFSDFSHLPPLGNGDIEKIKVPSIDIKDNNNDCINNNNMIHSDIDNQFSHDCFDYTNEMSFKVDDMFGKNCQSQLQENLKIGGWDLEGFIQDLSCFPILDFQID